MLSISSIMYILWNIFLCLMHILNVQIYHVFAYNAIVLTYFGKNIRNPFENWNYKWQMIETNAFMFETDSVILFQI